jgi:trk system potassium uptake protein TrkA
LCGGTAEAIEAIAHRGEGGNSVVGCPVSKVDFPAGIVLGALIRNQQVVSIHHDTVFEENDHVIMFAIDKKLVANIEKTFQAV